MISEIAVKILIQHPEYKESFDKVLQNSSVETKIKELDDKITLLRERIIVLKNAKHRVFLLNLSKRNTLSKEISNINNQVIKLKKEREILEKSINKFDKEVIDKANLYKLFSRLYSQKNEKDIKKIIEYFENDLEKIIAFCKENNIVINFTDEELFLKTMLEVKKPEVERKEYKKIESLGDIYLVNKTVVDGIPQNDIYYPSILTKKKKNKTFDIKINNTKQQVNISCIDHDSYTTKQWAMNQEVLSHSDAPIGWNYCDIIVIHKMTKKMYDQLFHFDPLDTAGYGSLKLEEYFIICTNPELAEKIKRLNPKCTPIVFPKYLVVRDDNELDEKDIEKRKKHQSLDIGAGNILLSCLGYGPNYKAYDGVADGRSRSNCYSDELVEKFPKLNRGGTVTASTEHQISELIYGLSISREVINKVIKEYCNDSFEKNFTIIKEVNDSLVNYFKGGSVNYNNYEDLILKKLNISVNTPKEYQDDAKFLDNVISFLSETNKLNPNKLFEIIISNINVDGNELALKKLKVMFLDDFNSFESNYRIGDNYDIGELLDLMIFYRRMVSSEKIISSKVDINKEINIPIDYLDLSVYEKYFEDILADDSLNIDSNMIIDIVTKYNKMIPPILSNVVLFEENNSSYEIQEFLKKLSDQRNLNLYKEELLKNGINEIVIDWLKQIYEIYDGKFNESNKKQLLYLVFIYKYIEMELKKINSTSKNVHK